MGERVGGARVDQRGKFGVDGFSMGDVCTMNCSSSQAQHDVYEDGM